MLTDPIHQDHPFFPHVRHTMMAAIIHFDAAPIKKGCVRVRRAGNGRHRGESPSSHDGRAGGAWVEILCAATEALASHQPGTLSSTFTPPPPLEEAP